MITSFEFDPGSVYEFKISLCCDDGSLISYKHQFASRENDAKMIRLFSAIDAAQAGDRYKIKSDLIFDVTKFRANKQVSCTVSQYRHSILKIFLAFAFHRERN